MWQARCDCMACVQLFGRQGETIGLACLASLFARRRVLKSLVFLPWL